MITIQSLRRRLDVIDTPVNDGWVKNTRTYKSIFEATEAEQRAEVLYYAQILMEMNGVKLTAQEWDNFITEQLKTERFRGTRWQKYITDWSKPTWDQPPGR